MMISALILSFISSFIFWPVFLAVVVGLVIASEYEKIEWALSATVGLTVLTIAKFNFPDMMFDTGWHITRTVGLYVILGVAWCSVKWILNARKIRTAFIEHKDKYLSENGLSSSFFSGSGVFPDDDEKKNFDKHSERFIKVIRDNMRSHLYAFYDAKTAHDALEAVRPRIGHKKKSVMMWIAYWPISMAWFILYDAVREIAETIYNSISGILQKMSDRMFKGVL